ncbi:MAG TPA: MMPL family transporter [Micromonosporaceae bacterium]|jgi:RND superfamily putative drug exporter
MQQTLTARIGRWSFRHRWTVAGIWLVAVIAGVLAAGPVFSSLTDDNGPASLESVQGSNQLDAADTSAGTVVGIVSPVDPRSAAVRKEVAAATTTLRRIDGVTTVSAPVVAADGHGLAINVKLGNLSDDALDRADSAISTTLHQLGPPLHATVLVGGGPLVDDQANAQAQKDLSGAEELSLPITLLILIVVFGGIVAAGLPVLAAVVSIAGSLSVLLVFSKLTSLDSDAVTVITLLGLGLSIDYGLLLVARYRDELAAGHEPIDAVGRAWATAGRTIVFSGLTVAAALSGMLVFGVTALSALGAAGVSITLVAMLVSLTFTAAMLRIAGKRVRPSKRSARRVDGRGFFAALARAVQRRPLVTALATGLVLIAAGLPILSMTTRMDNVDGLPRNLESVRAMDVQAQQYHQPVSTAVTVVARTDAAALNTWARTIAGTPGIARVHAAEQVGPHLAAVDIDTTGTTEGPAALHVVDVIRAHRPAGVQSWVTGDAALHRDVIALIWHRLPYAIGLTLLAMVVLLFAMTGSLVVPIKAVLMNLVSLSATFGALVAVFEHGVLAGVLHTTTVIGMSPFVIVTVFAFAFGLSMDYEVFLLARIKEQVDRGAATDVAVRRGLQNSGRIITSAALLMVVVFSCFVTGRIGNVQEIGLGLAIAIAVDATLVRCVLVPATMTLLGRANWWAPAWLGRARARLGLDRYLGEPELEMPVREAAPELVDAVA